MALGRILAIETEGTVFPNTDQPRLANNVFILFFFYGIAVKGPKLMLTKKAHGL